MLWSSSADDKLMTFSYFSQKAGFDISCKSSLLETIYMKCQILFSGENKKNISKCLLKFLPRVLSINVEKCSFEMCSAMQKRLLIYKRVAKFKMQPGHMIMCISEFDNVVP